jgi:hypothetical protein
MSHLMTNEPWGIVDLDLEKGHVFVRQDWVYRFRFQMIMRPWSNREKSQFHAAVDRLIWRTWSMRARLLLSAAGSGPIAKSGRTLMRACGSRGLTLSFDVRRREGSGHWNVNVLKLGDQTSNRSDVDFANRVINLHIEDVQPTSAINDANASSSNFSTVSHEFGHTLDAPDEYEKASPHLADSGSVMNIGTRIRGRHLVLLAHTLSNLVPGCKFTPAV